MAENRAVLRFDVLVVAVVLTIQVPNLLNGVADTLPQIPPTEALESMQNRGVIRLLLAVPGHHSQAGSPDSFDGRRPRVCRSARPFARPGRAARLPGSSASAVPWSCAWPRSH